MSAPYQERWILLQMRSHSERSWVWQDRSRDRWVAFCRPFFLSSLLLYPMIVRKRNATRMRALVFLERIWFCRSYREVKIYHYGSSARGTDWYYGKMNTSNIFRNKTQISVYELWISQSVTSSSGASNKSNYIILLTNLSNKLYWRVYVIWS